jgi:hypothetical protein
LCRITRYQPSGDCLFEFSSDRWTSAVNVALRDRHNIVSETDLRDPAKRLAAYLSRARA